MRMSPNHKIVALLILWSAISWMMIKGDGIAVSVTATGMVVPIMLIVAGMVCTKYIVKDSDHENEN